MTGLKCLDNFLDKDVFRTFYNRALAKRLLLGRSASDDFEKEVIKVLSESKWTATLATYDVHSFFLPGTTAYDAAFSDQAQMFSDLAISKDLIEDYRNVKPGQPDRPDSGLSVMVLQHSVWPVIRKVTRSETGVEVRLPSKVRFRLSSIK
jgi:cullin-4